MMLATVACGDPEYVYTRAEPAHGRKSPTTFVVRLSVDRARGTVTWAQDAHDAEGDLRRSLETWTNCTILDDTNWECDVIKLPGEPAIVRAWMRDGKLFHTFYGSQREYKRRRKVAGLTF